MHTLFRHAQSLPYFLALSLALHGLVLVVLLTRPPSSSTVDRGGSELRIQMVGLELRRNTAASARSRSLKVADVAAHTPHMHMQTERNALPEDTGQHSTHASTALENYLIGQLHTELSRHLVYPHLARERGWQGTVLISVVLAPDGVVQGLRLVHSSGHFLLDEASLAGLRKIHTLSLAGGHHWKDPIEVMLPIRFQLIDNS